MAIKSIAELDDWVTGETAPAERTAQPAPAQPRGFFGEAASALGMGIIQTAKSIGGALEMAGLEAGERMVDYYGEVEKSPSLRRPEHLQQDTVLEHPERLKDWRWWVRMAGENLPTMAAMMLPGATAMKAAQAGLKGVQAGKFAALGIRGARAAKILSKGRKIIKGAATAGGWTGAATVESGAAYNDAKEEMLREGYDPDLAERIATLEGLTVGTANAMLETAPFLEALFGGVGKKALTRIVRTALFEGTTETAQEAVNMLVAQAGHEPDITTREALGRALESGIAGLMLGGGAGAVIRGERDAARKDEEDTKKKKKTEQEQPLGAAPDQVAETVQAGPRARAEEERRKVEHQKEVKEKAAGLLAEIESEVQPGPVYEGAEGKEVPAEERPALTAPAERTERRPSLAEFAEEEEEAPESPAGQGVSEPASQEPRESTISDEGIPKPSLFVEVGARIRSGSVEGEIIEDRGKKWAVRSDGGMTVIVPKDGPIEVLGPAEEKKEPAAEPKGGSEKKPTPAEVSTDQEEKEEEAPLPSSMPPGMQAKYREIVGEAERRLHELEVQGKPTDTRAPAYVEALKKVEAIRGTVDRLRNQQEAVDKGYKRGDPKKLQETLERLQEDLDRTDLDDPRYNPVPEADLKRGGKEIKDPWNDRKITNYKKRGDYYTGIVWSYEDREPSYWFASREDYGALPESEKAEGRPRLDGIGSTEARAVAHLEENIRKDASRDALLNRTDFSREELKGVGNVTLRQIAKHRDIPNWQRKQTKTLIDEILDGQPPRSGGEVIESAPGEEQKGPGFKPSKTVEPPKIEHRGGGKSLTGGKPLAEPAEGAEKTGGEAQPETVYGKVFKGIPVDKPAAELTDEEMDRILEPDGNSMRLRNKELGEYEVDPRFHVMVKKGEPGYQPSWKADRQPVRTDFRAVREYLKTGKFTTPFGEQIDRLSGVMQARGIADPKEALGAASRVLHTIRTGDQFRAKGFYPTKAGGNTVKVMRRVFEEMTGEKLPRTVKGTREFFKNREGSFFVVKGVEDLIRETEPGSKDVPAPESPKPQKKAEKKAPEPSPRAPVEMGRDALRAFAEEEGLKVSTQTASWDALFTRVRDALLRKQGKEPRKRGPATEEIKRFKPGDRVVFEEFEGENEGGRAEATVAEIPEEHRKAGTLPVIDREGSRRVLPADKAYLAMPEKEKGVTAEPAEGAEKTAQPADKMIGVNSEGQKIYENEKGHRYVIEKVGGSEFKTFEPIQWPQGTPRDRRPEQYTPVSSMAGLKEKQEKAPGKIKDALSGKGNKFEKAAIQKAKEIAGALEPGKEAYVGPQFSVEVGGKEKLVGSEFYLRKAGLEPGSDANYWKKPAGPTAPADLTVKPPALEDLTIKTRAIVEETGELTKEAVNEENAAEAVSEIDEKTERLYELIECIEV